MIKESEIKLTHSCFYNLGGVHLCHCASLHLLLGATLMQLQRHNTFRPDLGTSPASQPTNQAPVVHLAVFRTPPLFLFSSSRLEPAFIQLQPTLSVVCTLFSTMIIVQCDESWVMPRSVLSGLTSEVSGRSLQYLQQKDGGGL